MRATPAIGWLLGCFAAAPVAIPAALFEGATVASLQQALEAGELTSEALVIDALRAIDDAASLNAFISVDAQRAKRRARELDALRRCGRTLGPLHGIPLAVKDNIHVAGLPNTAGTPALRPLVPDEDATAVARLKSAGAIVLGKTNMHELAYGITSNNYAYGAVGNAGDGRLIAGGSSGGTAAAIAAGIVVAGLGTDTGGSNRIPAALNGIAGLRPTTGRYPVDGVTRISHTRDTIGPMARSVADLALLDGVVSRQDPLLEPAPLESLRLGVPRSHFYDDLEPAVQERVEALLAALREAGVELIEADLENVGRLNEKVSFPIVIYETNRLLREYLAQNLPSVSLASLTASVASPDVRRIMDAVIDADIPEAAYREAVDIHRPRLQKLYRDYFAEHGVDAVVFPTTPLTARPIEDSLETVELNGRQVATFPTYIRNTDPGSNAGLPGLTLPLPSAAGGAAVGIALDGPAHSDRRLLAIGMAVENLINREGGDR